MDEKEREDIRKKQLISFYQLCQEQAAQNERMHEFYVSVKEYCKENEVLPPLTKVVQTAAATFSTVASAVSDLIAELPEADEQYIPKEDINEPLTMENIKAAESFILMNHWVTHPDAIKNLTEEQTDRMWEEMDRALDEANHDPELRTQIRDFMSKKAACPLLFDEKGCIYRPGTIKRKDEPQAEQTAEKSDAAAPHKMNISDLEAHEAEPVRAGTPQRSRTPQPEAKQGALAKETQPILSKKHH